MNQQPPGKCIANENNVSASCVKRSEFFAKGVDAAEEAAPGIKQEILTGSIKPTEKAVVAIAKAPLDERPALVQQLRQARKAETQAQRRGKHRIGCIGTAFEEFKRVGADLYKEALSLIVAAWQLSRPHPVDETGRRSWRSAPVFARELRRPPQKSAKRKRQAHRSAACGRNSGACLAQHPRQEYDPRRLVTRLHKTDPLTIYREGRAMGVNMAGYKKYLYQVFCIYNGSSKKKVLPMKF